MSMNAYLAAVDAGTLAEFRRDPEVIADYLEELEESGRNALRLRKMWQALHFMLTGSAWDIDSPLGQSMLGGEDIGPDMVYGPARFLMPSDVQEIANALSKISVAEFKTRFAPEQMEAEDIYPSDIWVREKDTVVEELASLFEQLGSFYQAAASRNDGMILWMT